MTTFAGTACVAAYAEPEDTSTLQPALAPGDLLWYDGTEFGIPLDIQTPKKIKTLVASSTLAAGGAAQKSKRYAAANLTDKQPTTAWCEGRAGKGVGETITIRFAEEQVPAGMAMIPGYAKNKKVWNENPRVAGFRVQFLKSPAAIAEQSAAGELNPDREYFAQMITGVDDRIPFGRLQYFDFRPGFTQDMSMLDYDGIKIEITAVENDGAKFEDTCISELRFFAWE